LVVDFVVSLLQRWSLGPEGMVLVFKKWGKDVLLYGIIDPCTGLFSPEAIGSIIDLRISEFSWGRLDTRHDCLREM
jgi:hypothetical protein